MNEFFIHYDQNLENDAYRIAINGLRLLSSPIATKWSFVLINSLTRIMCSQESPLTVAAAFQSLMFVADSISRLGGIKPISERNMMLVSLVHQFFEPPPASKKLLHDVMISAFVGTLQQKNAEVSEILVRHSWFAFDIIIKSMQIILQRNNMLDESVPRSTRFCEETGGVSY